MRQHEARSADCLQQVEEAGADSLIDPQRKCGLADRPLSSDPMTLSLDSRPPGTARINFMYFSTRTHCSLSLALVSFTHPGLTFCPLSILLTSVSDRPG